MGSQDTGGFWPGLRLGLHRAILGCPCLCPNGASLFSTKDSGSPLLVSGPRTRVGRGLRIIAGDPMGSAAGGCVFLSLVHGGTDGMVPGVFWSPRTTELLQATWSSSLGREAT